MPSCFNRCSARASCSLESALISPSLAPFSHSRVGTVFGAFGVGRRRPPCGSRRLPRLAQRPERCPELLTEEFRLFPRGEVAALRESVVVNQFGIGFLGPGPRGLIDLVWKGAHRNRDLNTSRIEKATLVFPIETSRRDRRIGQPVERDVVEDVISCQALGLPVENACDERLTARVVIKDPPCQTDRRIGDSV